MLAGWQKRCFKDNVYNNIFGQIMVVRFQFAKHRFGGRQKQIVANYYAIRGNLLSGDAVLIRALRHL